MNQKAGISVKYGKHAVESCDQSMSVRKGAGFHQKQLFPAAFPIKLRSNAVIEKKKEQDCV